VVAKYTSRGNAITLTRQIFGKFTRLLIFTTETTRGNGMTIVPLAFCAMRTLWRTDKIHQLWEWGFRQVRKLAFPDEAREMLLYGLF
jgi:hypothetical protein